MQHEFGFFGDALGKLSSSIDNLHGVLKELHRMSRPVVVSFHSEPEFIMPLGGLVAGSGHRRRLQKYLLTRAWQRKIAPFFRDRRTSGHALTNTRRSRVVFVNSGFASARTTPVPHGLGARNGAVLSLDSSAAKARLGYPPDAVVLSLFGFIAPYKGHDTAIRALRHLPSNYHLAIVGDLHPESRGNRALNQALSLAERSRTLARRVRVTGYAESETVDLYHAATDLCLAPYHDGALSGSAAITWALSSGKPVIASKIPSFCEIDDHAGCLLLFTDGCDHELAWQIQHLAESPALQQTLVERARAYADETTWAQSAATVATIYARLLGGGGQAASVPPPRRAA